VEGRGEVSKNHNIPSRHLAEEPRGCDKKIKKRMSTKGRGDASMPSWPARVEITKKEKWGATF